jgi:hypothetical protein
VLIERLADGAVEALAEELREEEPDKEGAFDAETLVLADADGLPLWLPEKEPLCDDERDVDVLEEREKLALIDGGNVGCVDMETLALSEELPLLLREELSLDEVLALRDADGCVDCDALLLMDRDKLPLRLVDKEVLELIETLVEGWLDADDEVLSEELPLLLRDELPLEDALALADEDGTTD